MKSSCDTRFNYQYHKKGWGGKVPWLKAPNKSNDMNLIPRNYIVERKSQLMKVVL